MAPNRKPLHSLRTRLVITILICWVVPIVMIVAVAGFLLRLNYENEMTRRLETDAGYTLRQLETHLDLAFTDSKSVSYDGVVRAAYRAWQQDAPDRIQQSKAFHHQERRDHTAAEKHGKRAHQGKEASPHHLFLAQRPGAKHRQDQVDGGAQNSVQKRIAVAFPEHRVDKNLLIGFQVCPDRVQEHVASQDGGFLGKGSRDDIYRRIKHDRTDQQQDNRIDNYESFPARSDPDAAVSACKFHLSFLLTTDLCHCTAGSASWR